MPSLAAPLRLRTVGRLMRAPGREVVDLLVAQWQLLRARLRLRMRPKGRLIRPRTSSPTPDTSHHDEERLQRIAVAVDRASRLGLFRPTCLVRSMAMERMIRSAEAGPAVVRIGVRPSEAGLLAHAWIELDGRVVGDRPELVRQFTPLTDFTALVP